MTAFAPLLLLLATSLPQGPQCRARIFWRCEAGFVDICNVDPSALFHQCVPK